MKTVYLVECEEDSLHSYVSRIFADEKTARKYIKEFEEKPEECFIVERKVFESLKEFSVHWEED